jgi:hypothetical protein
MSEHLRIWFGLYIVVLVLTFPFPYDLFSFFTEFIVSLAGPFSFKLAQFIGIKPLLTDLSSDSKSLLVFIFLQFIISLAMVGITPLRKWLIQINIVNLSRSATALFLALILFKYGLDKLFKQQFYLPEPNLLFTPLGHLDKDILYWSTMGVSRSYNIFLGMVEIAPAILLLFKKTRTIGAIIAMAVLMNIVAINFSFDISVKMFSTILLLLSIYLAWPGIKILSTSLLSGRNIQNPEKEDHSTRSKKQWWTKTLIIFLIIMESLYPHLKRGNFNDDLAPRPVLHGAYEVISGSSNIKVPYIKRVFIHRDGYLIFQDNYDEMEDFKMEINSAKNEILISEYSGQTNVIQFSYDKKNDILTIDLPFDNKRELNCRKINTQKLPIMEEHYHWLVD